MDAVLWHKKIKNGLTGACSYTLISNLKRETKKEKKSHSLRYSPHHAPLCMCVSHLSFFFIHWYKNNHYSSTLEGFMFCEWVKNPISQNWKCSNKTILCPVLLQRIHKIFKFPKVDHQSSGDIRFILLQNSPHT